MHEVRDVMNVYGDDISTIASSVDAHNAFNRTSRQQTLDEASKYAKSLFRRAT